MKKVFVRFFALLTLLSLAGAGCTQGIDAATAKASLPVTISIWGVVDDVNAYQPVLDDYRAIHPNVSFDFRRLNLATYEGDLLNALAEDRGPDIFLIHNDWTGKYMPKIVPMPASTKSAYQVITGTIQKTKTWQVQTDPSITLKAFKDQFADVVPKDTMRNGAIMGIPVDVDTMALYYNKDLMNAAAIPNPPENWGQFQEQTKKLTKLDANGTLLQSGAGIGTAYNVERAADLMTVLMMQNGAQMADDLGRPTFDQVPPALTATHQDPPSYQAIQFYTDFANPTKETYTWNNSQPNSLDAFIQGRTAFFFGYSYHLAQIRSRAPKLNLGITKLPQIQGNPEQNFANYWYWVVSKKTKSSDTAWNFLNFLARPEESKKVLDIVKRPAARKSQLPDQLNDEDVGVFASQVLTATSWYQGSDPKATEAALLQMIDSVVTGTSAINNAVNFAAQKIKQTY